MTANQSKIAIKAKNGDFAIIDPAYNLSAYNLEPLCDGKSGIRTIKTENGDVDIFLYATKHGNGSYGYKDSRKRTPPAFDVKSGYLAVIPIELWHKRQEEYWDYLEYGALIGTGLDVYNEEGESSNAHTVYIEIIDDNLVFSNRESILLTILTSEKGTK